MRLRIAFLTIVLVVSAGVTVDIAQTTVTTRHTIDRYAVADGFDWHS